MSSQRYFSDTLKQKKKKIKTIKVLMWFFVCLVVLGGLVFIIRLQQIQISTVKISGNVFVSTQEIQSQVDELLHKNIVGFIPRRNIFIFSKTELEKKLMENPAIVSVRIKKDFFNTLLLTIDEQEKEMVYCTSIEHAECFYINKTGFVYARIADFIIPEQEIIIYTEQQNKHIQENITDEKLYTDIVTFIKSAVRYDIRVGEVFIKSDNTIEFVTRDNARIITSMYDDFEKDFGNLVALFEKQILTKEQLSLVEYIDLRFGNKVFYKNRTN